MSRSRIAGSYAILFFHFFCKTSILFSMVVALVYIPTNSGNLFVDFLADGRSDWCEKAPDPCWHSDSWHQGLEDSFKAVASPLAGGVGPWSLARGSRDPRAGSCRVLLQFS